MVLQLRRGRFYPTRRGVGSILPAPDPGWL